MIHIMFRIRYFNLHVSVIVNVKKFGFLNCHTTKYTCDLSFTFCNESNPLDDKRKKLLRQAQHVLGL